MRISDWSSDVCSSDLVGQHRQCRAARVQQLLHLECLHVALAQGLALGIEQAAVRPVQDIRRQRLPQPVLLRSEEHTSEIQSLMRISYAVFSLKKKNETTKTQTTQNSK